MCSLPPPPQHTSYIHTQSYSVFAGGGDGGGVSVLGVEEWLVSHWPALSSALSLCLSLSASLSHTAAEEEEEGNSSE